MYENNYPNHYSSQTTEQSSAANTNNTYHYGNTDGFGNGYQSAYGAESNRKKKKSGSGFGKKIAIGICCGLCFGIFAGIGFQAVTAASDLLKDKTGISQILEDQKEDAEIKSTQEPETTAGQEDAVAKLDGAQVIHSSVTDVSQVVKDVMPAVVSVNNKYVERMSFFGQEFSQEQNGSGSGIIVGQNETELLLVTNYHVVESAEELTVQFANGSQIQAQIKGTDADKDLAVIAVQLSDVDNDTRNTIAIAELGSSDDLTVGEPVIAIGNALGYGQSVTTGVVSALNRPIAATTITAAGEQGDTEINTFIQTDAAINPGNSGGPLLNIDGKVIGINSNKIGGSTVEGMGYAIPISDVKSIIEDLMSKQTRLKVEEAKRGYLGITGVDVVSEYAEMYGMPRGVYVSSVLEGTGAAQAGLVKGDIITAIEGEEVNSMSELKEELNYYAAGTTVELTIMQGSPTGYQPKSVMLTLGAQEDAR